MNSCHCMYDMTTIITHSRTIIILKAILIPCCFTQIFLQYNQEEAVSSVSQWEAYSYILDQWWLDYTTMGAQCHLRGNGSAIIWEHSEVRYIS